MSLLRAILRRRRLGFTLVELMVALVGGLFVALAVIALSKQATSTVFEEARTSAAEMSLRLALDRLRNDVARASFMASPNIFLDPKVMRDENAATPTDWGTGPAPLQLQRMQGIRLFQGGSPAAGDALSTANGLAPDRIRLTGNMTTTDEFAVAQFAAGQATGACAGGDRFYIWHSAQPAQANPAYYRATAPDDGGITTLTSIFTPVAGAQFMVRVFAPKAKQQYQYLVSCGVGQDGNGVYVDTASTPPLFTGENGVNDMCANCRIAPVHTVDWYLDTLANATDGGYAFLDTTPADPRRFNLFRQWVDVTGAYVGVPELIAEYAVDLKFAFTVDDAPAWGPPPAEPNANTSLRTLGFDSAENATWGGLVLNNPTATPSPAAVWPQRIRSVNIRLVTRAQHPDRTANIVAPGAGSFIYRYCVNPPACSQFARARTMTTEVTLQNQAQAYYP